MRRAGVLLAALLLGACAHSSAFRAGAQAERLADYDKAVLEYSRALKQDPGNVQYRASLDRARLRASLAHTRTARMFANRGLAREALDEFQLALDLDPSSLSVRSEMEELQRQLEAGVAKSNIEQLKEQAREGALPGLALETPQDPLGLTFRDASLREVYLALGRVAGVNFVFDPQFQDRRVDLELRDIPFDQALTALATAGRTFHRVVDRRVITVVPDTPSKQKEYEQQVVKTLFLSNADLKETIDLLRIVLGARRVAPLPGANALTINDTPEKIAAAERIVGIVDKRRAEVLVEVEILEVNRSLLKEYGIQITSTVPGSDIEGVIGGIGPDPQQDFTLADRPYSKDNLVVAGLPGVLYRLLQSDASTRLLANPQLRTSEGETAEARFGDQVPVPVTVFTPVAQGGLAQQPVTSFEYKSVGVNIDITPRVHHDGDVSLALHLEVSGIGAAGYQGLPTFNSRTVNTVIRLGDGETSILAGLISDQERDTLSGLPGLADIPVLGRLFARNRTEKVETDIIMTLTPHIVSRPELRLEDLRSFAVGGEAQPLLFELPTPASPTPGSVPPTPRVQPVRPPLQVEPTPEPDGGR